MLRREIDKMAMNVFHLMEEPLGLMGWRCTSYAKKTGQLMYFMFIFGLPEGKSCWRRHDQCSIIMLHEIESGRFGDNPNEKSIAAMQVISLTESLLEMVYGKEQAEDHGEHE